MTQEVQSVIDRAVASGRQVTLVVIGGDVAGAVVGQQAGPPPEAAPHAPKPAGDPARWTPLERLAAAIAEHGEGLRKESDWAEDVCGSNDFSKRELERACQHCAVDWTLKDDGRDSGAREIEGKALQAFLELREEVRNGGKPAPEWWEAVVPRKHRTAK
jgi:hypothetical protein